MPFLMLFDTPFPGRAVAVAKDILYGISRHASALCRASLLCVAFFIALSRRPAALLFHAAPSRSFSASPRLALLFALVFRVVARRCSFVLLRYPLPWAFRRAYTAPEERRAEMSSKTDTGTRTGHRGCSRLAPVAAPEECPRTRDREIMQATSGEESRA